MKTIRIYAIFILCLYKITSYAQKQVRTPIITGTFEYEGKTIPLQVELWTYPKGNFWDKSTNYVVEIDKKNFKVNLTGISRPTVFALKFKESFNGKIKYVSMGDFYVEPTDDVHIDIFEKQIKTGLGGLKDSITFTGTGSAKYNLIEELKKDIYSYYTDKELNPSVVRSKDKIDDFILRTQNAYEKFLKRKETLILNYKGVSAEMKRVIDYQFNPLFLHHAGKIKTFYAINKNNKDFQNQIKNYYDTFFAKIEQPNDAALLSPSYFQSLNELLKYNQMMHNESETADLKEHYALIIKTFAGKIRERLLMHLFIGSYGMARISNLDILDSLLMDANKYLTSEEGKDIFINKLKFKKGTELFNADFVDLNGNVFNTASLKGKVFLLDMWGLGCSVCAGWHDKFENEMWTELKKYNDFVLLSVFDGKTKEGWLKGINSKLYTSLEYLNISNIPLGSIDHPFMKFYKVNASPFMILVDKQGKIISKVEPFIDSKTLLRMITDELVVKNTSK